MIKRRQTILRHPVYRLFLILAVLLVNFQSTAIHAANTAQNASDPIHASDHSKNAPLYQQTLLAIRKGHKSKTRQGLEKLQDYPLYPYLVKAELYKRLRHLPFADVDSFLSKYDDTVAGDQLHRKWLLQLAKKKRWDDYINYYDADVAGRELRCHYLEALHHSGFENVALDQTSAIWLSGKSLPGSCDNIFKRWQQAGRQTDAMVWQRTRLALEANNTLLARYLSKRASANLKPYTRRLLNVHRNPGRVARTSDFTTDSPLNIEIVSYGLQRLAARDLQQASDLWIDYRGFMAFSTEQYTAIRDKIARQIIASGRKDALDWLIIHDPNADDSYLLEWRIRLALREQNWAQAGHWISLLPAELQQKPRWRYWLARAYQQSDQQSDQQSESRLAEADDILQQLAQERHYYGFLAADARGLSYGFNDAALTAKDGTPQVETEPAIERAKEFLQLGSLTSARREWRSALEHFDQQQLIAATALAHQWNWYQQAIHTTIKSQQWNDLSVRFPLAYQDSMLNSAKSATIGPEWLYAIARQESAFAKDAYSSAGAKGLMQLRPTTAKQVARKMGIKYSTRDLYQADKNIVLGSAYLKQLLADFEGNRILATAAYNAGPHRVRKWLNRQSGGVPYDIWIETLPFHETRNYVQNVLAFSVIYGYRLGIDSPLIRHQELVIGTDMEIEETAKKTPTSSQSELSQR